MSPRDALAHSHSPDDPVPQERSIEVLTGTKREVRFIERALQNTPRWPATIVMDQYHDGPSGALAWGVAQDEDSSACMLLCTGFAGGLDPDCEAGDILLGEWLNAEDDGETLYSHPRLLELAAAACEERGLNYRAGGLLSVHAAVCRSNAKVRLWHETGALACSMEDFWLAREAGDRNIPYLAVRVVLDPATQDLPPFIPGLVYSHGPKLMAQVAAGIALRWWCLPQLFTLAQQARTAERELGSFIESFWSLDLSDIPYLSGE